MMRDCLPSASSANAIASCEPMESPSGRACDVIRKRCLAFTASRIWAINAPAVAWRASGTGLLIGVRLAARRVGRGRIGVVLTGRRGAALDAEFVENPLDAVAAFDRFVEEELE